MRGQNRKRFSDPDVLNRLRALESDPHNQAVLSGIRQQMGQRLLWSQRMVVLLIVGAVILAPFTRMLSIILLVPGLLFLSNRQKAEKAQSDRAYTDLFLRPVLLAVLPDTEIDYHGGIDVRVLTAVTPAAKQHESNCHIRFGDEARTEFCNLYSYHKQSDEDNANTVTDFMGQVFSLGSQGKSTAGFVSSPLSRICLVASTTPVIKRPKKNGRSRQKILSSIRPIMSIARMNWPPEGSSIPTP